MPSPVLANSSSCFSRAAQEAGFKGAAPKSSLARANLFQATTQPALEQVTQ